MVEDWSRSHFYKVASKIGRSSRMEHGRTSVRVWPPLPKKSSRNRLLFHFAHMFTVYVLFSEKFDKHYTGYSADFKARLISHNIIGNKDWAVKYRPWKVIYTENFESKTLAMQKEKWLKTGVGRTFIKSLPRSEDRREWNTGGRQFESGPRYRRKAVVIGCFFILHICSLSTYFFLKNLISITQVTVLTLKQD